MTKDEAITACLNALRKIGELDKPLEATSPMDWRRRASTIAAQTVTEVTKKMIKANTQKETNETQNQETAS